MAKVSFKIDQIELCSDQPPRTAPSPPLLTLQNRTQIAPNPFPHKMLNPHLPSQKESVKPETGLKPITTQPVSIKKLKQPAKLNAQVQLLR